MKMILYTLFLLALLIRVHCKHPDTAKKSEVGKVAPVQQSKRQLQLKLFGQSSESDDDPEKLLERVKQVSPERLNAILANYASEPNHRTPTTVTGETRKLDENGKTTNLMDELSKLSDANEATNSLKDLQSDKADLLSAAKKASPLDVSSLSPEPGTYDPLAIRQILAGKLGKIRDKDGDTNTVDSTDSLGPSGLLTPDDIKGKLATKKLRPLTSFQAPDMKSKLLAELESKTKQSSLQNPFPDSDGDKITDLSQELALKNDEDRKLQSKGLDYNPDSLTPLAKYFRRHHFKHNSDLPTDMSSYLALHNHHRLHRILGSQGPNLINTQSAAPMNLSPKTALSFDASADLLPTSTDNSPSRTLEGIEKSQRFRDAADRIKAMARLQEKLAANAAANGQGPNNLLNSKKIAAMQMENQLGANITSEVPVTKSRKPGFAFSYDRDSPLGPDMWSMLHSEWTCRGIKQSPIDIQTDQICKDGLCETEFVRNVMIKVSPQDKPIVGTLRNNGHAPTLSIGEEVSVRFFGANLLDVYYLKQLHFHFGCDNKHGSEHRIDGQTYPLELHLVFWDNKTFPTFAQAAKSDRGIVVVAVLFQRSFVPASQVRNTPLAQFLQVVKKIEEEDDQVRITEIFDLRLERMIPNAMNVEQADRFFVYEGSLTTPGCYESVTWVIYDTHPIVTDDQLDVFRRLKSSKVQDARGGDKMCDNYRPLQKLNGRRIYSNII